MSEPDPTFETRLESMERRLAELQRELAPEPPAPVADPVPEPIPLRPRARPAGPRPAAPPRAPAAPPPPPAGAAEQPARSAEQPAELELLSTLYGDLLGSVRRLLDGYEAALGRLSHPAERRGRGSAAAVEVTAGPFKDIAALREFERALGSLPAVREVTLRGYQSGNRAILEVQLERETS